MIETSNSSTELIPSDRPSAMSSGQPVESDAAPETPPIVTREPGRVAAARTLKWLNWRLGLVLVLAAGSVPVWRATSSRATVRRAGVGAAVPTVAVACVEREDLYNEVLIPAEFRPYEQVDLHAKVSGYVQGITVDIGDQVKAGQLLAKLEVPELQDQLNEALATQKKAEADYRASHLAYTRLLAVDRQNPNLVVQQELDAAEAKDHTTEAATAAAKAVVERYQTLLAYTRITAPFDGVITHRYADPGSLIQSGTASDTQSLPLVRIADNYRLRLDFPVAVGNVKDVHVGDPVEVRVESLGGKRLSSVISRFTHKVNDDTRTMTTEIEVPNPNLELTPGMYAQVLLKVQKSPHALSIPTEAVSPEKNTTVYVVGRGGQIEERSVTLGLETPTRYEVKNGLKEGDLVLVGGRSELRPGQKVQPKLVALAGT
jgi:RND family efflux transporter MFP subunit